MLRELINKHQKISKYGFRYRGLASSRIENLTDAVFGFAITLLVIASQVPQSYVELQASMYDFVGFVACVLLLFGIWNNHSNFFKHYGLQDKTTKSLNFLFLFVLLFYIYPLKYLFSFVGSTILINLLMAFDFNSPAMEIALQKTSLANMEASQWTDLMIRFGLGLFFIYLILGLMHVNALKQKKTLELNDLEVFETRTFMMIYAYLVFITMFSMSIVIIGGGSYSPYSGMVYMTIPIVIPIIRKYRIKRMIKTYPNLIPNQIE
jgi:uncharacterized membrane protein